MLPVLGSLFGAKLDPETLDSFYDVLRTCREHCNGRKYVEHRKAGEHECTDKCRPHVRRPLAASSIREVHFTLSGAVAYWDHDQVDRQMVAADEPLRALDPGEPADRLAAA